MDDSQSSDVFSNGGEIMDTITYEYLVSNIKLSLNKDIHSEVQKSTFSSHFSLVIGDCSTCISQSLDLIIGLLSKGELNVKQLLQYLDDAVNILRLLCSFITTVLESVSMSCSTMRTFPTTTGRIIMTVFSHCRDSESVYGRHLKSVENQLKDLFRNCHELQLTYLMVLEKHFIFELTEYDELNELVEALDINLKIGEIVQTLDVKTMVEQWKAHMIICEKNADALSHKNTYQNSADVLCRMIENNIKTAMETNQDEKIVLRSLKVASFTLRVLAKTCAIFKQAAEKNYRCMVQLLLYTYRLNPAYLESVSGKSPHFVSLVNANVTIPSDAVLKELLVDDKFAVYITEVDIYRLSNDENLGYMIMVMAAMRASFHRNDDENIKIKLTDCVFKWLPNGHVWLNMNLKLSTQQNDNTTCGLFEHLLTHMYAFVSTLNSEEFSHLERRMLECLLSTDCYSAVFSSNLWELLTRIIPHKVLCDQVAYLCKTYEQLSNHKQFRSSPQHVHLSTTIGKLFNCMGLCDKAGIYRAADLHKDDMNNDRDLWSAVQVKNFPTDIQEMIGKVVKDKLKSLFHRICTFGVQETEDIESLTRLLRVGATLEMKENTLVKAIEGYIVKIWLRICPNNKPCLLRETLDEESKWYLEFIEALVSLTLAAENVYFRNCTEILHVVSIMIQKGSAEMKLILIDLIAATTYIAPHRTTLAQVLLNLLDDKDEMVRNKISMIKREHLWVRQLISEEEVTSIQDNMNTADLTKHLEATKDLEYSHKCLDSVVCIELNDTESLQSSEKTNSGVSRNFDFADIDTLFESESDGEPACKKAKLDINDIETILTRLETNAALLYNVKENVNNYKDRIASVYEKLRNILD